MGGAISFAVKLPFDSGELGACAVRLPFVSEESEEGERVRLAFLGDLGRVNGGRGDEEDPGDGGTLGNGRMGGGLGGGRSYLPNAVGRTGLASEIDRAGDGERALGDGGAA